jgi:protein SCO1/2
MFGLNQARRSSLTCDTGFTLCAGSQAKARATGQAGATLLLSLLLFPMAAFAGYDSGVGAPKPGAPAYLPPGVVPRELEGVGVDEHLGRTIDLDLEFVAEDGYPVKLRQYFNQGRPVILDLVYYNCPMLCTLILNAQTQTMKELAWTAGKDYEVVTISINPQEAFDVARKKKSIYLDTLDKPAPGWHFLTDKNNNAKKLAELIGYHYRYDERQEQYAHPSAIMILTPEGKLARYLYGIRYPVRDVRFALAEASEGRFTMAVEKILLYCYHYDPQANRYVLFAMNIMRGGGILTVLIISFTLWRLFKADKARTRSLREGLA